MSFTKFYDDNLITKFVKSLVSQNQIPMCKVWKPGKTFIVKDMLYIANGCLCKALKTGRLNVGTNGYQFTDLFKKICDYVPFKQYYNATTNYTSNISGYDSKTHYYLGEYLRFIRDYYNIDLMQLYNCFCGEYVDRLTFNSTIVTNDDGSTNTEVAFNLVSNKDPTYTYLLVPIKFDTTYSVFIGSNVGYELCTCFYGRKGFMEDPTNELGNAQYAKVSYSTLTSPYIFKSASFDEGDILDTNNVDNTVNIHLGQLEEYYRLFIKIPAGIEASVVVLEGDYSLAGSESNNYSNISFINGGTSYNSVILPNTAENDTYLYPRVVVNYENILGHDYNAKCVSNIGLTKITTNTSYAFNNKLIEYLLLNVITPEDSIDNNILRVQQYISSSTFNKLNGSKYRRVYTKGVWADGMKEFIYNAVMLSKTLKYPKTDVLGYVDRLAETVVTRGQ